MSTLMTFLAQDGGGGGPDMFIMIGMIFLIFWFLVIRPGSKERKARERAVKALTKHDKVVTNAGIHGTVMSMDEENVVLRVDDKNNIRLKFSRAAIWQVLNDDDASDKKGAAGKDAGRDAGRGEPSKGKGAKADKYAGKKKKGDDAEDAEQPTPETASK